MTNKTHVGFLLVMLTTGLAGCDDGGPMSPTVPAVALPQPTPAPPPPTPSGRGYNIANVTLSGVVFEMTPEGRVPIDNVAVFLPDDQYVVTDANGFFSFWPVWVCPCRFPDWLAADHTIINATKDGYTDPPGQPELPSYRGLGWRVVAVHGDTRFDVELVRR